MAEPSKEKIAEIKAKFPERSIHQIDFAIYGDRVDGKVQLTSDNTHTLILTAPSKDEHEKYSLEMTALIDMKGVDRIKASRRAGLHHLLALTRWPDRDDVQRLFDGAPEAIDEFHQTLRYLAGAQTEVRAKKL